MAAGPVAPHPVEAPPAPPRVEAWADGVGLVTGLFFAGVTARLDSHWSAGLQVNNANVSFDSVTVTGTGLGVGGEWYPLAGALEGGPVAGASVLWLPWHFVDRSDPTQIMRGSLTAWGAVLSAGYEFAWWHLRLRPALTLAYLDLPAHVNLTEGPVTGIISVEKVRGWLPGAQIILGFAF
jgi:hypothetical protein